MLLLLPTDVRNVYVIQKIDVASLCRSAASCRDMRDGTNELRQSFFRIRAVVKWALPSNTFRVVVCNTIASQASNCNSLLPVASFHRQNVVVTGYWRSASGRSELHGLGDFNASLSNIRRPWIEFLSIGEFVMFPGQQSFKLLKTLCPALLDAPFFDDVFRGVESLHLAFKEYEHAYFHREQHQIVITVTTALGTLELLGDIITSMLSGARSTAEPHPFINEITHINWMSILFRKA